MVGGGLSRGSPIVFPAKERRNVVAGVVYLQRRLRGDRERLEKKGCQAARVSGGTDSAAAADRRGESGQGGGGAEKGHHLLRSTGEAEPGTLTTSY